MKKEGSTDKRYLRRTFNRSYYYKKGEKAEEANSGSKKFNGVAESSTIGNSSDKNNFNIGTNSSFKGAPKVASANGKGIAADRKGKDVDVQSEGDLWDGEQEEVDFDDEELFYTVEEGEAKNKKVSKMTLSGKEKELLPPNGEEYNRGSNGKGGGNGSKEGDSQDKNNILCPLCVEVLDETDRNFFPCDCGYQICLWCLYYIRDHMCNKCPACRRSYDEKNFIYNRETHEKLVKKQKSNHKGNKADANNSSNNNCTNAPNGISGSSGLGASTGASICPSGTNNPVLHHHSGRSTAIFNRPDLYKNPNIYNIHEYENIFEIIKGIRVVQRNLVFVIGITSNYAKKNILKKNEYFGKYGQILNIIVNKSQAYNPHYNGPSFSAYITYSNEKEAINAIYFIDGMVLDNKTLKASFGTTKYCAAYLKNSICTNEDCFYLHELGNVIDSFSKDDIHGPKHIYHDLLYYYFKKHPDKRSEQSTNFLDSSGNVLIKSTRKSEDITMGGVGTSGGGPTTSVPPAMLSFAAAMSVTNEKDISDTKKKSDTPDEVTQWKKQQHSSATSVLFDGKAKSLEIINKGIEKCADELKRATKMKDGLTSKGTKDNHHASEEKSKWSSEGNFANLIKNAGVAVTPLQEVEEEKNNTQTKSKKKKKKQKSEENIAATDRGKEDHVVSGSANATQKEKNYKDSLQNNGASKNDNTSKNNSLEVEEDPYYVDGMSENYPLITDVHFDKDKKKKMKKKAEKKKANEKKKAEEVKMREAVKEGEGKMGETEVEEAKTDGAKTGTPPTEDPPAEDRKPNGKGSQSTADAAQKEQPSEKDFPPLREEDKDSKKQKKKNPASGSSSVNIISTNNDLNNDLNNNPMINTNNDPNNSVSGIVENGPAKVEDQQADGPKENKQSGEQAQVEKKNKYAKIALKIGSFFNYAFDGGRKGGGDEAKAKTSPSGGQKANKKTPTTADTPSVVATPEDVKVENATQPKEDPTMEGLSLSKQKKVKGYEVEQEETNVKEDRMREKGEKKNEQSSLKRDNEKVGTDVGIGVKEKKEVVEEGAKKDRGGGSNCKADKEDTYIGEGNIQDEATATAISGPSDSVNPPRTREKRDKKNAQENNISQEQQMKKHAQEVLNIQKSNPDVPLQAIIEDYIERRRADTKEVLHFHDLHNAMNNFMGGNAAKGERSNQHTDGSTAHGWNVKTQEHLHNGEGDQKEGEYAQMGDTANVPVSKPEGERQSVEKTQKGMDTKNHVPCAKEKKKKDTLNKRKLHQKEMEGDITSIIREMMMHRMRSKSRRNKNGSVRETSGKSEMGQTDHRVSSGEDPTEKNALFDDMEIFLKNLCVAKGKAIQSSLQNSIGSNLQNNYADRDAVYLIEGNGRRKNDYLMYTNDERISLKSHKGVMEFIIKKDQNIDVKKNKKNYLHEDTFDIYKELILSKNSDLQTANDILFEKIFNEEIDFVQQLCKENCLNGSGKTCSSNYTMEKSYYEQNVNLKKKCKKKMQATFPNLWVNFNQSLHTQEMSEKVNLSA
ncbi:CCR4-NOT transcription complex subunit 4, putative [Plasmodium knowlesi strain H]|uniref:CCR4-NOT transcription complex subunit 4, putative n=3 Tax=Plasmodium knowlesi TaxID=5850 RepID=A0A5K1U104_PLAKH|nr:uncharacterized protein PKNH_1455000 [Plasmodium knowlesi strain H]OTN64126.1 putative CCR4-NOT transcription complex subunit 4 [Plasmodium knowlesi]CAA9991146.1 CCR4-NOT transcription complex subunit 4, putative [Plasmodium knowlesi strain H]SBO27116.1 CCR4-NOT transcription complex subunit 4, putative [Plasmodium knowlesi strain H]SBO29354.1 CCR4-NOT transcription complex subunit 4, putative [Plasmodium knowlesi strain H]VVS80620.1 CCR4-NOT transcription complex subunit 4, putative [Plasm|eukprot:XP_002262439.1 [Plasmodium knowlesi strain H]